jgi:hypothetical protein
MTPYIATGVLEKSLQTEGIDNISVELRCLGTNDTPDKIKLEDDMCLAISVYHLTRMNH